MFADGTLQQFAGDFGQTTLSSLQFFFWRRFSRCPQFQNLGRPQHQELRPTLCDKCVGSLMFPTNQYQEDAGDRAYGFLSWSEKTRMSNCLQMS